MAIDETTLDEWAYAAFMEGDSNDVLKIRQDELQSDLDTLNRDIEDGYLTLNEFDHKKEHIMARLAEINEIKRLMGKAEPNKRAHCIGRNGTISMWEGKDHSIWVETDGVKTVVMMDPKVSDVVKWRRILGVK